MEGWHRHSIQWIPFHTLWGALLPSVIVTTIGMCGSTGNANERQRTPWSQGNTSAGTSTVYEKLSSWEQVSKLLQKEAYWGHNMERVSYCYNPRWVHCNFLYEIRGWNPIYVSLFLLLGLQYQNTRKDNRSLISRARKKLTQGVESQVHYLWWG